MSRRVSQSIGYDPRLTRPVRETFDFEGVTGLDALPHIGKGIAAAIAEILITGRWNQLERLRGTLDPVKLFQGVPGIGPQLAQRAHETLHVDTLEALKAAAHDGRLESVPGVGARRAAAWRATLAVPTRFRPQWGSFDFGQQAPPRRLLA